MLTTSALSRSAGRCTSKVVSDRAPVISASGPYPLPCPALVSDPITKMLTCLWLVIGLLGDFRRSIGADHCRGEDVDLADIALEALVEVEAGGSTCHYQQGDDDRQPFERPAQPRMAGGGSLLRWSRCASWGPRRRGCGSVNGSGRP